MNTWKNKAPEKCFDLYSEAQSSPCDFILTHLPEEGLGMWSLRCEGSHELLSELLSDSWIPDFQIPTYKLLQKST